MKKISLFLICSILIGLISCQEEYPELEEGLYAEFKTNKGTFVAELYYQATPLTVASFVSLAEGTNPMVEEQYKKKPFYDGLTFHRVIGDFMIQGGDPTGTGSGGPGYEFPNEIVDTLTHNSKGILSMANSGPDTNGSQFFITLKETPWLDGRHTVFGKIVKGQEIVDQIGQVETDPGDKPVDPVVMEEVNIIRKGEQAENFEAAEVLTRELEAHKAEAEAMEQKVTQQNKENQERLAQLKQEAEKLESGLQIAYLEEGEGPKPKLGDTVMVNYIGYLPEGKVFDTNLEEVARTYNMFDERRAQMGGYSPMPVVYSPDTRMIPGFIEGVQQMNVGDKALFFIPSHLGYGERGAPPVIPANSDLIFEVEMVQLQE